LSNQADTVENNDGILSETPRMKTIKELRNIADDLQSGYGGFNFLVGYDFANLDYDIEVGKAIRAVTR